MFPSLKVFHFTHDLKKGTWTFKDIRPNSKGDFWIVTWDVQCSCGKTDQVKRAYFKNFMPKFDHTEEEVIEMAKTYKGD